MINDGQPIKLDLKTLTQNEKNKFADDFAEGSQILKELLLKMWNNGIETYACCVGHEYKSKSYLFFEIKSFTGDRLRNLLLQVITYSKKGYLDISISNDFAQDEKFERRGLALYRNKENISVDEFFTLVDKVLFSVDEKIDSNLSNVEIDIINASIKLYDISMGNYLKNSKKQPSCQVSSITIYSVDHNFYLRVLNNISYKCLKIDNKGKQLRYLLAEGYYRKTANGKYYALKNNKFIELNLNELKTYKLFRIYKKYKFEMDFNINVLNNVIDEMS